MKLYRSRDYKKAGIYCIKNLVNNKIYVGKAINIYGRITQHINYLNNKSLNENRYLINSWHKYGRDNFSYYVLEYLEKDENLLKERELYWFNTLNCTDRNIGYNLRIDTSTNCIVLEETKKLQSINRLKKYKDNPSLGINIGIRTSKFWKDNPQKKLEMSITLKLIKQKYDFLQLNEDNSLVKRYNTVEQIIQENPTFKWQNIYSVCNGYKKRMYGYKWKKELKI